MYIYVAGLEAAPGKAMTLAGQMGGYRDALSDATGLPWSAWSAVAGQPYGNFGLSVQVNGVAELIDGQLQAAASQRFQELSGQATGVMSKPAETNLYEIVAITGEVAETKPVVAWTRATLAGRGIVASMAWATEMMQHITEVTGVGGAVAISGAGQMFSVSWIMSVETGQRYDEVNAKISADAKYLAMLDDAEGMFVPGSSERVISVRMP
jgi:hypothetical protein